jgi:hypothetical protein
MSNSNKISKVEYSVEFDELTFWFQDSEEPFGIFEFRKDSKTRERLMNLKDLIEDAIDNYNSEVENA